MVPVILAAVVAAAERRFLDAFRLAGATAPERAVRLEALGLSRDDAFDRLVAAGLLRDAGASGYYLDEAAVIARRDRKPPRGVWIALGVMLVLLLIGFVVLATRDRAT